MEIQLRCIHFQSRISAYGDLSFVFHNRSDVIQGSPLSPPPKLLNFITEIILEVTVNPFEDGLTDICSNSKLLASA